MATKIFRSPKRKARVISFLEKKKSNLPMSSWATEKFQLPSDGGGVLDGDQQNSIAIQHINIVQW
jgi:hypothetical protein